MSDYKDEFEAFTENLDEDSFASSAWDCTGLIPSLPESESELEAYEDLYHFVQPAKRAQKKQ